MKPIAVSAADHVTGETGYVHFKAKCPHGTELFTQEQLDQAVEEGNSAFNAVIQFILGPGRIEEPLEFLRCWNEGDFESCRNEWPEAPEECYIGADPTLEV